MARSYRRFWDAFAQPTVGEVGARADRAKEGLKAEGRELTPVEPVRTRQIATTFWGKAWCRNLTRYSDYANRMPRGRSYVRYGAVVHLVVEPGEVRAFVSGTDLYRVTVRIKSLPRKQWDEIRRECAGEIEALVDLLQGKPPRQVMAIVTRPGDGLFPTPKEIEIACSCPDWAEMCKHAAAVLYGVGVRLDHDPEQLFALRSVDPNDLVSVVPEMAEDHDEDDFTDEDLSEVFGIRLDDDDSPTAGAARRPSRKKASRKKATRKKTSRKKSVRKKAAARKTARKTTRKKAVRRKATPIKGRLYDYRMKTGAVRKKIATRKKKVAATTAKKATSKKAVRKKAGATRKKAATRKKSTREKAVRKTAARKKTTAATTARKKAVRKKAGATRKKTARKPTTRKKTSP